LRKNLFDLRRVAVARHPLPAAPHPCCREFRVDPRRTMGLSALLVNGPDPLGQHHILPCAG
jgi:hypothetical protein